MVPALVLGLGISMQARAGLFADDEARKAILDLRAKIAEMQNDKADKSSIMDLAEQNELLRQEIASLRGKLEVLSNELANLQRRQKDFYTDLDSRVGKFEPRKMAVDGKEALVHPEEKKEFDAAEAQFQGGKYKTAISGYAAFLKKHPKSAYASLAQYGLGNAYFLQKDYKNAYNAQNEMIKKYPDSTKVPDAMFNMASSQIGLKNKNAAKKTLEALIAKYPDSEAAKNAKQRLSQLK